jgi:hypothetical protein
LLDVDIIILTLILVNVVNVISVINGNALPLHQIIVNVIPPHHPRRPHRPVIVVPHHPRRHHRPVIVVPHHPRRPHRPHHLIKCMDINTNGVDVVFV